MWYQTTKTSLMLVGDKLYVNPERIESIKDCTHEDATSRDTPQCIITMATGHQHKIQASLDRVMSQIQRAFSSLSKMS